MDFSKPLSRNDYSVSFFCFILLLDFACLFTLQNIFRNKNKSNNQDLTIKESFLTGPKLKLTVTSNFLMSPNSNYVVTTFVTFLKK